MKEILVVTGILCRGWRQACDSGTSWHTLDTTIQYVEFRWCLNQKTFRKLIFQKVLLLVKTYPWTMLPSEDQRRKAGLQQSDLSTWAVTSWPWLHPGEPLIFWDILGFRDLVGLHEMVGKVFHFMSPKCKLFTDTHMVQTCHPNGDLYLLYIFLYIYSPTHMWLWILFDS